MQNFVKEGCQLTLTAPTAGVVPGMLYIIGTLAVVSQDTAAEATEFVGDVEGVFELPKASGTGVTFAQGALVSWDASTKKCVAPATGKYPIGVAIAAAADAGAVVSVRLSAVPTAAAS